MITMLATLCHMAVISPDVPPIEFCQEQVIAQRSDLGETDEAVEGCYVAAQITVAASTPPAYTVKQIRCAKGNEMPRDAI